jgi:hypothetical protein|tara:strand:- start:412 stop:582 length:171 start_codon:yes stop_codon:yes gene_type:complete
MANQYSITVSDESAMILKSMKESGYKASQAIDEAIKTLGQAALTRLIAMRRRQEAE